MQYRFLVNVAANPEKDPPVWQDRDLNSVITAGINALMGGTQLASTRSTYGKSLRATTGVKKTKWFYYLVSFTENREKSRLFTGRRFSNQNKLNQALGEIAPTDEELESPADYNKESDDLRPETLYATDKHDDGKQLFVVKSSKPGRRTSEEGTTFTVLLPLPS